MEAANGVAASPVLPTTRMVGDPGAVTTPGVRATGAGQNAQGSNSLATAAPTRWAPLGQARREGLVGGRADRVGEVRRTATEA